MNIFSKIINFSVSLLIFFVVLAVSSQVNADSVQYSCSESQNGIWSCAIEGMGVRMGGSGNTRQEAYDQALQRFVARTQDKSATTQTQGEGTFGGGLQDPALGGIFEKSSAAGQESLTNLELFISRMVGFLTVLAGVAFILYFVLGAFGWVVAGGDSSKVQKARDQMVQGVLGLIVVVATYAVIGVIGTMLGIRILEPATQLRTTFGL